MKTTPRPLNHPCQPKVAVVRRAWLCASLISLLGFGCDRERQSAHSCCETNVPALEQAQQVPEAQTKAQVAQDRMFAGELKAPAARPALALAHKLTRHDGAEVDLRTLVGQPLAVSFAYTSCVNPNKCRLVSSTMKTLRAKAQEAGLLDKVKLVLITYDAQHDTPQVMCDYARKQGLELDDHTLFLRPANDPDHRLFRDLHVNASFNLAGVTIHGIQLLLVDKAGRLARTYQTLIWDNDQVVTELAQLSNE